MINEPLPQGERVCRPENVPPLLQFLLSAIAGRIQPPPARHRLPPGREPSSPKTARRQTQALRLIETKQTQCAPCAFTIVPTRLREGRRTCPIGWPLLTLRPNRASPSVNSSVSEISLDKPSGGRDSLIRSRKWPFYPRKQSRNRSIPTLASKPKRQCGNRFGAPDKATSSKTSSSFARLPLGAEKAATRLRQVRNATASRSRILKNHEDMYEATVPVVPPHQRNVLHRGHQS